MQTSIVAMLSLLVAAVAAAPAADAPCTTTIGTIRPFNLSPTKTVYEHTETAVSELSCGGCLVVVVNRMGHGPVAPKVTTTVTSYATNTVHVHQCVESNAVMKNYF